MAKGFESASHGVALQLLRKVVLTVPLERDLDLVKDTMPPFLYKAMKSIAGVKLPFTEIQQDTWAFNSCPHSIDFPEDDDGTTALPPCPPEVCSLLGMKNFILPLGNSDRIGSWSGLSGPLNFVKSMYSVGEDTAVLIDFIVNMMRKVQMYVYNTRNCSSTENTTFWTVFHFEGPSPLPEGIRGFRNIFVGSVYTQQTCSEHLRWRNSETVTFVRPLVYEELARAAPEERKCHRLTWVTE